VLDVESLDPEEDPESDLDDLVAYVRVSAILLNGFCGTVTAIDLTGARAIVDREVKVVNLFASIFYEVL